MSTAATPEKPDWEAEFREARLIPRGHSLPPQLSAVLQRKPNAPQLVEDGIGRTKEGNERGPGRPSLGRTEHLEVMLTPEEKQRYENAARQYGLSLSDWVRLNLTASTAAQETRPRRAADQSARQE